MARRKRKCTRKNTMKKKKPVRKPVPHTYRKKSDTCRKKTDKKETPKLEEKKEKPKLEERKETKKLAREACTRMKQLQQDGIFILIDQPNLEKSKAVKMQKQRMKEYGKDDDRRWTIKYGKLIDIIARKGCPESKPRNVLRTSVITSKKAQVAAGFQLSKRCQKDNDIEYIVSPVRNVNPKTPEKGVDCILVRKMVEEYTAIEMLRLQGLKVPKRTFCVLSADSDFVDVVRVAREKGFGVELWFFDDGECFSEWKWNAARQCDSSGRCSFGKKNLETHTDTLTKWKLKDVHSGDWSEVSGGPFSEIGNKQMQLTKHGHNSKVVSNYNFTSRNSKARRKSCEPW